MARPLLPPKSWLGLLIRPPLAQDHNLHVEELFNDALNGKFILAPLNLDEPGKRILEAGTADGLWLRDVRSSVSAPHQYFGSDIEGGLFPQQPDGITYFAHSFNDPWPSEYKNTIDLVHLRGSLAGSSPNNPYDVIKNLANLVQAGGWVQLQEMNAFSTSKNCPAMNDFTINEGLLRRIFDYPLLQQHPDPAYRLSSDGQAQMITGLAFPQPSDSELLHEVRFGGLLLAHGRGRSVSEGAASQDTELQALFLPLQSNNPDPGTVVSAATVVMGTCLNKQLRLVERMDPERPLSQYGMDSLTAVEFRNWVRTTLKVDRTTLDVVNATSLVRLSQKVIE